MIEKQISSLIEGQFPTLYQDDAPNFIIFVQKYFEWLEQESNVIGRARRLTEFQDIDKTLDEFVVLFKEKYLKNVQFDTVTDGRDLVRHSLDLHRSKGSERSFEIFFRLVYGVDCDVYYPSKDVFKTSDNIWNKARFVEIQPYSSAKDLVGKQCYGGSSGATAYVEKYMRRKSKNHDYNDILYLTNIQGDFIIGDPLLAVRGTSYINNPIIQGSLSGVTVQTGGTLFNKGDVVKIESESSNNAIGRVTKLRSRSGAVDFTFVDGGWGYTSNADTLVSDYKFFLNDFQSTSNDYINILTDGNVYRSNVVFNASNVTFLEGQTVTVSGHSGRILSVTQTGANGSIVISRAASNTFPTSGNLVSNTGHANIISSASFDASYRALEDTSIIKIELPEDVTGVINFSDTITQGTSSGIVTNILKNLLYVGSLSGTFDPTSTVTLLKNGQVFDIVSISSEIRVDQHSGTLYTDGNPTLDYSDTTSEIDLFTSGLGASFDIGDFIDTETNWLNDDFLADYIDVPLAANNYGFPGTATSNVNTSLWEALNFQDFSVGSFTKLTNVAPGTQYVNAPKALVVEYPVTSLARRGYKFYTTPSDIRFIEGEKIYQDKLITIQDVVTANGANFLVHEHMLQGNVGGEIISISNNTVSVKGANGTFVNSANVQGSFSNVSTAVSSVSSHVSNDVVVGRVRKVQGDHILFVDRLMLNNDFTSGPLTSELSGATANLISAEIDMTSLPVGLNSQVDTEVNNNPGAIEEIEIISSGYGYSPAEAVRIYSNTESSLAAVGIVKHSAIGIGSGYFSSRSGFLSDNAKLFDGDYYQEFSYEIRSTLPVDKYKEALKKVLHVAGTKMFGEVYLKSEIQDSNDIESLITEN